MRFTRIMLSIVFVLFASSAFAEKSEKIKKEKKEKPGKILVCHVGSEEGPDGDALKVDLISVSPKAKHIGNAKHSFVDAEGYLWEDYSPEEGVGDEAADFEEGDVTGIDRGCELDEPVSCPCWSSITVDRYCDFDYGGAYWSIDSDDGATRSYTYLVNYKAGDPAEFVYCSLSGSTVPNSNHELLDGDTHSEAEFEQCRRDIQAICDPL